LVSSEVSKELVGSWTALGIAATKSSTGSRKLTFSVR
jgi:hypothetical protein